MAACVSKGYVFQMEMIIRARQLGYTIGRLHNGSLLSHRLVLICEVRAYVFVFNTNDRSCLCVFLFVCLD